MPGPGSSPNRRELLRGLGRLGLLGGLAGLGGSTMGGCAAPFAETRLTVATGAMQGGYFALGTALAQACQRELELRARPEVLATNGSIDNLGLLAAGTASLVFCQVDVAAEEVARSARRTPGRPARWPGSTTTGARGHPGRLGRSGRWPSCAAPGSRWATRGSGVSFITRRLLAAARLDAQRDLRAVQLGIGDSVAALTADRIDAFFWSGSLPTQGISALAGQLPIRLVDLADVVEPLVAMHPEYAPGTVPAGSYGIPTPVTSLLVRNVLLVAREMPDELAEALVRTLFATQEELTRASPSALTIDTRAAIGTQPVLLHPGAEQFYRSA